MSERAEHPADDGEDPWGEGGEPTEPEECDYVTADDTSCGAMHFREYGTGRLLLSVKPDETSWVRAVRDHMDRERFWPNVWSLSDHGNWHLLRLDDE